jgi:hypothetical protein
MIRHIVLYTYQPSVSYQTIVDIYTELDKISSRLPGRLSYTWGEYQSPEGRNKGYTHALVTDFANVAAQNAFLNDPIRLEFSQREVIPRMIDGLGGIVSFDFFWGK